MPQIAGRREGEIPVVSINSGMSSLPGNLHFQVWCLEPETGFKFHIKLHVGSCVLPCSKSSIRHLATNPCLWQSLWGGGEAAEQITCGAQCPKLLSAHLDMQTIYVFQAAASHNGPVMFKFKVQTLTEMIHGLWWKKAKVTAHRFLCK